MISNVIAWKCELKWISLAEMTMSTDGAYIRLIYMYDSINSSATPLK